MDFINSADVEFVGPFNHHDVIVDGRRVPHITAEPRDGGKVLLVCDRARGIELPVGVAEEVASFVAFAIEVAERGINWPRVHGV